MTEGTIGILGGMGPWATLELYRRITEMVPAKRDQDHPRIIIDSNAKVPDRTEALLHGGPDPRPYLLDSARTLARAGVDLIAMPCNTAHHFHGELQEAVDIPVLHMLHEAAATVPVDCSPVGIMATSATVELGLYQSALAARGLAAVAPDATIQEEVMEAIAAVKANVPARTALPLARRAAHHLAERGARAVMLGCTELSVLTPGHDVGLVQIDPLTALAEAALRRSMPAAAG